MYRGKDRKTIPLFSELFPFGGKLDIENRWIKIAGLIPWDQLENKYRSYFSEKGRPSLDGRLVLGMLLLKHMTRLSDEEIVRAVTENPYMQWFCGLESFTTASMIDSSSLSKIRKRVGAKYFAALEDETYRVLIERKIIRGKGMLVDATVFPEYVRYPTDTGLLNEAREWVVKEIKGLGKAVGEKVRTYYRKAKREYLNFSKKKQRSRKVIQKMRKSLLQHLRRNIKQIEVLIDKAKQQGEKVAQKVHDGLTIVRKVYEQQLHMYKKKVNRIEDRIVSIHRPWTRPIVRGKSGGKEVEFGPKATLSYVDGLVMLDHIASDNFSEAHRVAAQIEQYERFFGHKPPSITADNIYGNRENRTLLKEEGIRSAFKPLGRKAHNHSTADKWYKNKQRERNRIEGSFGHGKNHCGLDKIKYYIKEGPEIWVRLGLLGMNLRTAVKRI